MTGAVYYNEWDPKVAAWLRELIAEKYLPKGDVDERDIRDVTGADVRGYTQAHFFAGIGGWALALQMAGWSPDEPIWTGSCPCQPFSTAGLGGSGAAGTGFDDSRHLWPEYKRLIEICRPPVIAGEQVNSSLGRLWLAGVREDCQSMGYAFGAADIPAGALGAPHQRSRIWFVAYT